MARVSKKLAIATMWNAMSVTAGKRTKAGEAGDRDLLVDGMALDCDLVIAGRVQSVELNESVIGSLTVGHAGTTTRSESVPTLDLLAWLLARHGEEDAARSIDLLTRHYEDHLRLPDVSPASQAAAKALLDALKTKTQAATRGPVKFSAAA